MTSSPTTNAVKPEQYLHPLLFESQHLTGADYLLHDYKVVGELGDGDLQLVRILLALALRCPEDGHSFLHLGELTRFMLSDDERRGVPDLPSYDVSFWLSLTKKIPNIVGLAAGEVTTPLVLEDDRLYLAKLYGDEREIARVVQERWRLGGLQSRAATSSAGLFVLLGGPGTGKTSTIAVRLIRFINSFSGQPKISMAAPTGKAALRMKTALKDSLELLDSGKYQWAEDEVHLSKDEIAAARTQVESVEAFTIHKLLAFNPANERSRWGLGRDRRLDCDLLIVDECSMVSLELLSHLLRAVPKTAHMWFVGDPDQLASVGVGSVLADIESAHTRWVSMNDVGSDSGSTRVKKLGFNFRQQDLASGRRNPVADLVDSIRASARDAGASCLEILESVRGSSGIEVKWIDPTRDSEGAFRSLLAELRADALLRCDIAEAADALEAMKVALSNDSGPDFKQVLCVHRHGDFGVSGMNSWARTKLGLRAMDLWYPGRPVLVTRNDNTKRDEKEKMWNGDTGVVVRDGSALKLVLTEPAGRGPQPVARLSNHEVNYAMTIHKSQGSEYNDVVVMLPMKPSRICTREMLYTAVSRAKKNVVIVGPRTVVEHMLKTAVTRASWLGARI
jgi:exodeoxyribonuclease V alpha subunit